MGTLDLQYLLPCDWGPPRSGSGWQSSCGLLGSLWVEGRLLTIQQAACCSQLVDCPFWAIRRCFEGLLWPSPWQACLHP